MPGVANCDGRHVLIAADGATVLRREGANDIEVASPIKSYGFGNLAVRTIGFLVRASLRDILNNAFAGPRPLCDGIRIRRSLHAGLKQKTGFGQQEKPQESRGSGHVLTSVDVTDDRLRVWPCRQRHGSRHSLRYVHCDCNGNEYSLYALDNSQADPKLAEDEAGGCAPPRKKAGSREPAMISFSDQKISDQKISFNPKSRRRRPMPSVLMLPANVSPPLLLKLVFWKLPLVTSSRIGSGTPRNCVFITS
jgi:hypothetical protein